MNLVDKFDEGIVRIWWEERKRHPKTNHYVTDVNCVLDGKLVGKNGCMRKQYYDWIGEKPTNIDPTRILFTMVGKILHKYLFKRCWESAGLKVEDEEPFKVKISGLKFPISGRVDFIVDSVMVEVKTTQGRGITSKEYGVKYKGVKPETLMQICFYKEFSKIDCNDYSVFYFGRDNFYRTEFRIDPYLEFDWESAFKRFAQVEKCLEKGIVPPDEFPPGQFPCTWCIYETKCALEQENRYDRLSKTENSA
ncbi:MAG: hypothetical protein ACTSR2_01425 [Candidatus Hodarchaeales archaeon]